MTPIQVVLWGHVLFSSIGHFFGRLWCILSGTTANAVGVGVMIMHGCSGLLALHVPAMQEPMFSVRAALAWRMTVHLCPGKRAGQRR
jgi:hypothetical protein